MAETTLRRPRRPVRNLDEFIAARTAVFDPWPGTLHVNGKAIAIEAPATAVAVAKIIAGRA